MKNAWFRLPIKEKSSIKEKRAGIKGYNVSYVGGKSHHKGSAKYVARVYGTQEDLDALADEPGVQRLSKLPKNALQKITGKDLTAEEFSRRFRMPDKLNED